MKNISAQVDNMRQTSLVVAMAACLGFGLGGAATAADLPVKAPAYTPVPYDWSGLYLGANFGSAFSSTTAHIARGLAVTGRG
jgi:hypothetical protein